MASGRGVERVLAKLNASVEAGNYYEAHQMYRTLFFRYKNQNKFAEAINLLYSGATTLLKHNQHASGSDLALLMVDIYNASDNQVTDDAIDKVSTLYGMIDKDLPDRATYTSAAIQWSSKGGKDHKMGHPKLHQKFAAILWKEKNYAQSRYHFMHSPDGAGCASMLIEYHITRGYSSEVDLFIAQAVFQYLCLKNTDSAHSAFTTYTKKHPQVENGPPFIRPLLNFLWFLLLAVEGGKVAVFSILCEQYKPSLQRDPNYREYLDRIGQLFFGLPPPKQSQPNIFGNLIQSLFNFDEDEESDEEDRPSQSGVSNVAQALETEDLD